MSQQAKQNLVIYKIIIIILIVISLWLLFRYTSKKKSFKRIDNAVIKDYVSRSFSEYEIIREIAPKNINRTFIVKKNTQRFLLKITCKNTKRAQREALLLQELRPDIPTPRLISSSTKSIPGHILMSDCGNNLETSANSNDYYKFGKIISHISQANITSHTKKLLARKRLKYIKKLAANIDLNHPYARYYSENKQLSKNCFCHGDMHINQAIVQSDGSVSIIDWESAALSYRIFDLSTALSHCLKQKLSIEHAQAILSGYKSSASLDDNQEIKLLLSLIWYDLNKTHYRWMKSDFLQKNVDFINPLLVDRSLEDIFNLTI